MHFTVEQLRDVGFSVAGDDSRGDDGCAVKDASEAEKQDILGRVAALGPSSSVEEIVAVRDVFRQYCDWAKIGGAPISAWNPFSWGSSKVDRSYSDAEGKLDQLLSAACQASDGVPESVCLGRGLRSMSLPSVDYRNLLNEVDATRRAVNDAAKSFLFSGSDADMDVVEKLTGSMKKAVLAQLPRVQALRARLGVAKLKPGERKELEVSVAGIEKLFAIVEREVGKRGEFFDPCSYFEPGSLAGRACAWAKENPGKAALGAAVLWFGGPMLVGKAFKTGAAAVRDAGRGLGEPA